MKTTKQVRDEMRARGETYAQWAAKHGVKADNVYAIMFGRSKGFWGESHKIAVLLGLKKGELTDSESRDSDSVLSRVSSRDL